MIYDRKPDHPRDHPPEPQPPPTPLTDSWDGFRRVNAELIDDETACKAAFIAGIISVMTVLEGEAKASLTRGDALAVVVAIRIELNTMVTLYQDGFADHDLGNEHAKPA